MDLISVIPSKYWNTIHYRVYILSFQNHVKHSLVTSALFLCHQLKEELCYFIILYFMSIIWCIFYLFFNWTLSNHYLLFFLIIYSWRDRPLYRLCKPTFTIDHVVLYSGLCEFELETVFKCTSGQCIHIFGIVFRKHVHWFYRKGIILASRTVKC